MDRFEGIIESMGSFIGAFFGILLFGGVIFAIVKIISNSKKPRIQQYQQNYQQQFYQTPPGQMPPYQRSPYQGQPYPTPPQKNDHTVAKAVIIGLVLYFVVFPILGIILIFTLFFGAVSGCNRQRQEAYDNAINSISLYEQSDFADSYELGDITLTKLFASGYAVRKEMGDCLSLANESAYSTALGSRQGYLVLTDKAGSLLTDENEFYTNISLVEDITYENESVIICTKELSGGYYTPRSDKFEDDQVFFTKQGKKINANELEYDISVFKGNTASDSDTDTAIDEESPSDYTIDSYGSATVLDKNHKGSDNIPDEVHKKVEGYNSDFSMVITDKTGKIVFPKNGKAENISEAYNEDYSIDIVRYTGDIYKKIYSFDMDKGIVCAIKYDNTSAKATLGLFDLDGKAVYTSDLDLSDITDYHSQYYKLNDLVIQTSDIVIFKSNEGYDLVSIDSGILRSVKCRELDILSSSLFTYIDNESNLYLCTFSSPDNDTLIEGKYILIPEGIDDILYIESEGVYTYYTIS